MCLQVLLWQRAREPDAGRWALPGGLVLTDEDVDASASRQLAEKVDLDRVAHLEQIGVFSDPDRVPDARVVATGFLGLVPLGADPRLPEDTAWHPVDDLPPTALDHGVDRRPGATGGCRPSCRTPTSASRWRPPSSPSPSCAGSTRPRWRTTSTRPTCSAS